MWEFFLCMDRVKIVYITSGLVILFKLVICCLVFRNGFYSTTKMTVINTNLSLIVQFVLG